MNAKEIVDKIRKNSEKAIIYYNTTLSGLKVIDDGLKEVKVDEEKFKYEQPDYNYQIKFIQKFLDKGINIEVMNAPVGIIEDNKNNKTQMEMKVFKFEDFKEEDFKSFFIYQWYMSPIKEKSDERYDIIRCNYTKEKTNIYSREMSIVNKIRENSEKDLSELYKQPDINVQLELIKRLLDNGYEIDVVNAPVVFMETECDSFFKANFSLSEYDSVKNKLEEHVEDNKKVTELQMKSIKGEDIMFYFENKLSNNCKKIFFYKWFICKPRYNHNLIRFNYCEDENMNLKESFRV